MQGRLTRRGHGSIEAAFAAGLLLALTGPAGASERVTLSYEVYRAGFHVVDSEFDVLLDRDRYEMTAHVRSTGLYGWLVNWSSRTHATGGFGANGPEPQRYRLQGEWRGQPRLIEIAYQNGVVADVTLEPSLADEQREEVPASLLAAATDPASAIMAMVRRMSAGETCSGRLPVFDGRRRYDLVFVDRGRRPFEAETVNPAFSGEAIRCDFSIEPIAGHLRPRWEGDERRWERQEGHVWVLPPRDGLPATPIRLELEGFWGSTIVSLKTVRRQNGSAG